MDVNHSYHSSSSEVEYSREAPTNHHITYSHGLSTVHHDLPHYYWDLPLPISGRCFGARMFHLVYFF